MYEIFDIRTDLFLQRRESVFYCLSRHCLKNYFNEEIDNDLEIEIERFFVFRIMRIGFETLRVVYESIFFFLLGSYIYMRIKPRVCLACVPRSPKGTKRGKVLCGLKVS